MSSGPLPEGARIEIQRVHRRFRTDSESSTVIDSLDLSIQPGEFVALLGPSGCGKSTLLRMIAGLDSPDQGVVAVESVRKNFFRGYVFQDAHLMPWRTVLENSVLPLELMRRPLSESQSRATEILQRIGLKEALGKYPNQLSGGMKMRVSLARALVAEPTLLLLDEPFAALDEDTRHSLQEDLYALWEKLRMTVVFVTHSVSEAAFLAQRVVVLSPRPARILLDRPSSLPRERSLQTRMTAAYLGEVEQISRVLRRAETK